MKISSKEFTNLVITEVGTLNPKLPPVIYDLRISQIKMKWLRKLASKEIVINN